MSQNKEIETQLRIIHACEKGATGVYYGHRIIAKLFFRDMITTLDTLHRHETEHFYLFGNFLNQYKNSVALPSLLWCIGGIFYGLLIGLFGRNAIWVSTASIENIVNKELEEAAFFFKEKNINIYQAVLEIQEDEISHQHIALVHADFNSPIAKMIAKFAQQCAYLAKFLAIHLKISLPSKHNSQITD
ncbi:demethoxyubiquinone hydroxylase family protein [Acinetobacter beijerinckii]|uniref:demethoxyubiquinone hydroxylase family protein n=1 Tax=Acinetobacter beijerinckii TaxID=262668 RepID=UPI003AF72076